MKASISPTNLFYIVMALFVFTAFVVIVVKETFQDQPKYAFKYINHISLDSAETSLWAYWINTAETINSDSLPAELIEEMRKHGSRFNNNNPSFYYLDREGTNHVATVFRGPGNQQVEIILNPE